MDTSRQKLLALTFDDGPNTTTMVQIMDLLDQFNAKATFFVVGNMISAHTVPVLKNAAARGFEIGNHGMNHLHMSNLTAQEILTEVQSLQEILERDAGIRPTLFRPPYLDVDDRMRQIIDMPFISGAGNYDWDPLCTVSQRVKLALEAVESGAVLLMHCFAGNDATVEALRIILPEIQRRGYRMVTVSELFRMQKIPLQNGILYDKARFSNSCEEVFL